MLYTVSLFFSIFANYYIGLFTCIFVFLLFFVYQICRWGGWKKFFCDLGRIALFSAIAIGMSAILTIPALTALGSTQSSVNKFPTSFRLNIAKEHTILGLLDAMRQVAGNMGGSLEPNFKEGLPNLYCGIVSVFLMFLYLMAKEVRLRDKICAVGLLLFFNVSFIIRQLDYIRPAPTYISVPKTGWKPGNFPQKGTGSSSCTALWCCSWPTGPGHCAEPLAPSGLFWQESWPRRCWPAPISLPRPFPWSFSAGNGISICILSII